MMFEKTLWDFKYISYYILSIVLAKVPCELCGASECVSSLLLLLIDCYQVLLLKQQHSNEWLDKFHLTVNIFY